jgi:hypothetical protein
VSLSPADPLDARIEAAFNDHQRRDGRLGPDAAAAVIEQTRGKVVMRQSPWQLDAAHGDLMAAWFDGWIAAAGEQDPALTAEYRHRRPVVQATVDHADLLVLP